MMDGFDFGKELKRIRKRKGITQSELAEKCKLTICTIQRIESGAVKPRSSTIRILSDFLEIDFFESSHKNSKPRFNSFLFRFKELFNLKKIAMKNVMIFSISLIVLVLISITATKKTDFINSEDYEILGSFSQINNNWFIVKQNNNYGVIDEKNKLIIPIEYDAVRKFGDAKINWVALKKDGKYGIVTSEGKFIIPVEYSAVGKFGEVKENWSVLKKDGKYGIVDTRGQIVVPTMYTAIGKFGEISSKWTFVKVGDKYGLINTKGERIVDCEYDKIEIQGTTAVLLGQKNIKRVEI